MLKPTSNKGEEELNIVRQLRQDRQRNNTTDQLVEDASGSPGKASAQPRDQLTTLETQLQSKEARLNWMLEAEMEAQNAGNTTSGATPARPTVTRSWAVETRLRRQLVAIPPPMRDMQPDPRGEGKLNNRVETQSSAIHQRKAESGQRVLPVLVSSPPASSRTDLAHCTPSPPTESHSPADQTTAASRRSRVSTIAKSHPTGRSELTTSTEQMKASSILKMAGSGSGDPKTRAEIIEEYKRARRVELEAMMRTMVQK
ncbi:hypothetical protein JG688_00001137 [Phytophthora aleatoria]|uniref:Uncharacterized protein n=1 Tax=Phytophthora aleatoria TaxID=2496075 RepID=A0A8J5MBQ2_9STRA|nr:hypothetical protein JG688_00001137 [Phytophthora aleatoria]